MAQELRRAAHKEQEQVNDGAMSRLAVKAGLVLVLILFLVMVYGRDGASDIDLGEFRSTMKESCDMGALKKCSDRDLMRFIGINGNDYESYIYYKNMEALSVEELLIIKTDDETKLAAVKDACEDRIDSQISIFEGYGIDQVRELKQATLFTKGDYLFFSVGDNSFEYEEVFRNAIQ